ncbi:carbohydrate ABC transporter permease [Reyranella sp.]|uniref:carbohydrate ABC transporter permease n=1 Tax=Reyranella sp. TaxID=1929291 RepID=UPI003BA8F3CB
MPVEGQARQQQGPVPARRRGLHALLQRRSAIAFLMTVPLLVVMVGLVAYPTGFAIWLSMLDRTTTRFVGLANFALLLDSSRFWGIVWQTCLFAFAAVALKAFLGFVAAHFVHNLPARGQRKWRGMLLVPWVIPAAMSVLAWRLLFEPSFGALNWILEQVGLPRILWLGETGWARLSVILVTVWFGAPFFMVMYLASLKSVPAELYEAASIDGATWWQRIRYVTLPMMRNIIAITMIFSLIGSFAGFTIVNVLTNGGPLGATQVLGTSAFLVGIIGGNLPMGAAISLFMVPVLAAAAILVLRGVVRRGSDS